VLKLADAAQEKLALLEEEALEEVANELAATEEFEIEQWEQEDVESLMMDLADLARLAEAQGQSLFVWMHPLLSYGRAPVPRVIPLQPARRRPTSTTPVQCLFLVDCLALTHRLQFHENQTLYGATWRDRMEPRRSRARSRRYSTESQRMCAGLGDCQRP
ncbi:MAG: hypothetical protein NTX56_20065, partial [Proteobacteria bacterium]|nr:hypothetical protein [Pseudomonadota bacterium]